MNTQAPYSTPWKKGVKRAIEGRTSVFILSDSNLPGEYLSEVEEVCSGDVPVFTHSIEGGEKAKTLSEAQNLYLKLNEIGAERKTLMVCLGGGTITDLGGYVASTYKRGMKLVLLPTTLLAMVDAAIGGKNGVNLEVDGSVLKNQIGTFLEPEFVGLNTNWLESLSERELRSGWAEMAKHALLKNYSEYAFETLVMSEQNKSDLDKLIPRSAKIKWEIASKDLFEKGSRAQLNLGHTVGHALETIAVKNSEIITHGEAVAWGLIFALEASKVYLDYTEKWVEMNTSTILEGINKKINLPPSDELWAVMKQDKKNQHRNVTDVLLYDRNSTERKTVKVDFIWKESEFTQLWEDFRKKHA